MHSPIALKSFALVICTEYKNRTLFLTYLAHFFLKLPRVLERILYPTEFSHKYLGAYVELKTPRIRR
jgi:hypothetical protein